MTKVRIHSLLQLIGLLSICCAARAVPVYINDPAAVIGSFGGFAGEARFKVDNNNWDLGFGPAVGTSGSFLSQSIGRASDIVGRNFSFELRNDPIAGLTFFVRRAGTTVATLDWGTSSLGGFTSLDRAYNTIRITARATGTVAQAREASLTDVVWNVGGAVYNDASGLADLLVNRNTPASSLGNFPSDSAGSDSHWIATGPLPGGTNLSSLAWRLTGGIRFDTPQPNNNPNESLRLSVSLIQYNWNSLPINPTPPQVPEPGTYLTIASGLAFIALLRKRAKRN